MTRNASYLLLAIALIVIGAGGYDINDQQHRRGVEVNVGGRSLTIETR